MYYGIQARLTSKIKIHLQHRKLSVAERRYNENNTHPEENHGGSRFD